MPTAITGKYWQITILTRLTTTSTTASRLMLFNKQCLPHLTTLHRMYKRKKHNWHRQLIHTHSLYANVTWYLVPSSTCQAFTGCKQRSAVTDTIPFVCMWNRRRVFSLFSTVTSLSPELLYVRCTAAKRWRQWSGFLTQQLSSKEVKQNHTNSTSVVGSRYTFDSCWIKLDGKMASSLSTTYPTGRNSQLIICYHQPHKRSALNPATLLSVTDKSHY